MLLVHTHFWVELNVWSRYVLSMDPHRSALFTTPFLGHMVPMTPAMYTVEPAY
jgi:hypothetical protein